MKIVNQKSISIVFAGLMAFFSPCYTGQCKTVTRDTIISDGAIIAPGYGSDGVVLGEDIREVVRRFGKSKFRISKPARENELFKHVFKVAGTTKIFFDAIYNNADHKFALCVFRGTVVAVLGFDNSRTTIDGVNVQSGVDNFIFNYGNRNIKVLGGGTNKIYLYPDRGIAVVDDDVNDTIDLYLVFPPGNGT